NDRVRAPRALDLREVELVVVRLDSLGAVLVSGGREDRRLPADHELRAPAESHLPVVAVVTAVDPDQVSGIDRAAEELEVVVHAEVGLEVVDLRATADAAERRRVQ